MGQLPRRDGVSFGYMWSADQNLGTGIGHWHPHMMIFAPYYDNSMLGNNEFGSLFPQLSDGSGTPFAVVVITVDNGWPSRCARERQPQKESRGLSGRIPFPVLAVAGSAPPACPSTGQRNRPRVSCCQSVTQPKQLKESSHLWYAISVAAAVQNGPPCAGVQ